MNVEPISSNAHLRTQPAPSLPANGPVRSDSPLVRPSFLYRAGLWRLGLMLARALPHAFCAGLAQTVMRIYAFVRPERREIVVQNLLPALHNDRAAAERMSRALFQQFALKLTDLLRFEAGLPVADMFTELTGWEHFVDAQKEKRGVLLLTPHLGNWEFGAPLLTQRGYQLQVITLVEPGSGLTEMRQASRARWGIETLVIGEDPFAIVDVIRRLEGGATVALLVDRPPPTSAVTVELFGRPFAASIAAAELARASGCLLLPVYLPRNERGYAANILPTIPYERAALRERDARRQLTQEIMRAFEPAIRQHVDQWYHFVPIWPTLESSLQAATPTVLTR
ncbi:MAG: lysophospholipid acyltransferase family protein [Verrucomicrobia bacterium]|nr:lysophospholipid acyltransferase family protein [Verrucomicrobiota bacterium]